MSPIPNHCINRCIGRLRVVSSRLTNASKDEVACLKCWRGILYVECSLLPFSATILSFPHFHLVVQDEFEAGGFLICVTDPDMTFFRLSGLGFDLRGLMYYLGIESSVLRQSQI